MTAAPFAEMALLLGVAAAVGALATRLKQPVLIAYIAVGILVGPAGFGLVQAHDEIDLLAQIGVAVLLFLVGLKLDLEHVRHIGPVALATGLGQLGFTILFGFLIILALGKGLMEALYVAVALTFSSTIIIVKLLSDKRELDSLHGRIAVGFLIVQDIAVVIAMLAMSTLRGAGATAFLEVVGPLLARVSIAVLALFVLMRYVLPRLVAVMARSQELLLIFAIAWGTGLAALGEWAGFSKEGGPSWPASRSPLPPTARPSAPGLPVSATFSCCSSSSTWAPSLTSPPSVTRCGRRPSSLSSSSSATRSSSWPSWAGWATASALASWPG